MGGAGIPPHPLPTPSPSPPLLLPHLHCTICGCLLPEPLGRNPVVGPRTGSVRGWGDFLSVTRQGYSTSCRSYMTALCVPVPHFKLHTVGRTALLSRGCCPIRNQCKYSLYQSLNKINDLKGQCHQIFHLCFFSSNNFSWPQ